MKPELHIEPEVVYRKRKGHAHAHHGGAWKIAYADFVTAMMAFFMLLWIIGATNEDQRKGIADYFTPTIIQMKNSGGSNGILGGRALASEDGTAPHAQLAGPRPVAVAGGGGGGPMEAETASKDYKVNPGNRREADDTRYRMVRRIIESRLAGDPTLKGLKGQVRLVRVQDGLQIDIVERADFSMFALGTSVFTPDALKLVRTVAAAVAETPNRLIVRGHTDSVPYTQGQANNWSLSTLRADATRRLLADAAIPESRFRRIEGVADTDPYNIKDGRDPSNRRISITLLDQ
ncbi:flagellar motor protein MotB [Polymorphobacter sp.]|uniref:flagellar motor protein MotB n=1 Tax=Polymorphobacter sp. TaxID=1909290 RepID=UPI003F72A3C0